MQRTAWKKRQSEDFFSEDWEEISQNWKSNIKTKSLQTWTVEWDVQMYTWNDNWTSWWVRWDVNRNWNSSWPKENWTRCLQWKDRHWTNLGLLVYQLNYKESTFTWNKVFAGSGGDCNELTKENRKWVAIQLNTMQIQNSKRIKLFAKWYFLVVAITAICIQSLLQRRRRINISHIIIFFDFRVLTSECWSISPQNAGGIYSDLTFIDLIIHWSYKKFWLKFIHYQLLLSPISHFHNLNCMQS